MTCPPAVGGLCAKILLAGVSFLLCAKILLAGVSFLLCARILLAGVSFFVVCSNFNDWQTFLG